MLHCLYLFRDQDMITITHCSCHCFFHRLFSLIEGLKDRELCVFFRNNHFSTMFKVCLCNVWCWKNRIVSYGPKCSLCSFSEVTYTQSFVLCNELSQYRRGILEWFCSHYLCTIKLVNSGNCSNWNCLLTKVLQTLLQNRKSKPVTRVPHSGWNQGLHFS